MTPAQSAHLALLCKCRRLELTQVLLNSGQSVDVAKWAAELALNADCLALLEPSSAVRAA